MKIYVLWLSTLHLLNLYDIQAAADSSKLYRLIYHDFDVTGFDKCVRIMNRTHEIGCQSTLTGNRGVLYHVNSLPALDVYLAQPDRNKYIVLLEIRLFRRVNVDMLKDSEKTEGVILYEGEDFVPENWTWSPDDQCPEPIPGLYNSSFGAKYENCKNGQSPWNLYGEGLFQENIPFPVFFMRHRSDVTDLINCYESYNVRDGYPKCSVEMKSRMYAAVDSVTCVRRTELAQYSFSPAEYCDPMGGSNNMASLKNLANDPLSSVSTVLVMSPIDSRSFMQSDSAPGVDLATGFITLLAVANTLGKLPSAVKSGLSKNIVFVVVDGEAFDNMGTSSMVYDMKHGQFPVKSTSNTKAHLRLEQLAMVVELRQLGHFEQDLWVHYDPVSYDAGNNISIDSFIAELSKPTASSSVTIKRQTGDPGIAPSSSQTILKSRSVPAVVLTDYDATFVNRHYFSRYDTLENVNVSYHGNETDEQMLKLLTPLAEKLARVTDVTSRALYETANDGGAPPFPSNLTVDVDMITHLLFCYLHKANCSIFKRILPTHLSHGSPLPNQPINRYVGVYSPNSDGQSLLMQLTHYILAFFVGYENGLNETACNSAGSATNFTGKYLYFPQTDLLDPTDNTSVCKWTSTFQTSAADPYVTSGSSLTASSEGSIWTESRWNADAFSLRMYLVQDPVKEGLTLMAGLIVLGTSFVAVYFIDRRSDVLFSTARAVL